MARQHHRCRPWHSRGVAAFLLGLALALGATWGGASAADKSAVMVLDANNGRVLYQSAADALRHPASLTKLMTLYLLFERIEQGRVSYQTKIKMSATAAAAAPSKLDLEEGEEIAVIDAMRALITKSANDVAVAVAEHIAGSEPAFARLMNQKARQLGMMSTVFKNASGLPDDDQVTTARDMVVLALRLQEDFPRHYPLFATRNFTYKDSVYRNHNTLLFNYEGTQGLKTGYTRASGFNVVSSVQRGRKHLIGAVFGSSTASSRDSAMRTFLNMGLVKASTESSRRPGPPALARPNLTPETAIAAVPTPKLALRPPLRPAALPPLAALDLQSHVGQPAAGAIEIARVRRVLVTSGPAVAAPASTIEALLARQDAARQDRMGAFAAAPAEATPWAAAAGAPTPLRLAEATAQPALADSSTSVRQPSTLLQQAAVLQAMPRAPPLTTQALPAPAVLHDGPPRADAVAGGFQIQIGAYESIAEAERQLALVRGRIPDVLRQRAGVTPRVQQGHKVLYRARYAGFDGEAAASACSEMKRLNIDCLVLRAD